MEKFVSGNAKRLAVGCFYLLARRAIPNFPGSTRGSPSEVVFLELSHGPLIQQSDKVFFPMRIPWYIWKNVVIPLITVTNPGTDPSLVGSGATPDPITGKCYDLGVEIKTTLRASLRIEGNVVSINRKEYDVIIGKITQALGMLLEDQGYVPLGLITNGGIS